MTANHTDQYSCYTREVETNVCVCPKGKSDFECLTASYTKCYLNITDPTFYQGCEDREDSPYYLYSVPGYSPCWPVNFTEPYTVEFYINCRPVDETGLVEVQREEVGYEYRDVIKQPEFVPFSQVSQNHEASFSLGDDDDWQVFLDLRDFKYLSHFKRFNTTIKEEAVKNGSQPATVEVVFQKVVDSDKAGDSYYVVGGRTYFEAHIFGKDVSSFTYKGFFDEWGYEEPKSTLGKLKAGWIWALVILGVLIIVGIGITIWCCMKSRDKKNKVE